MKTRNRYYVMNSGTRIYPDDVSDFDINLQDIAHHLTNIQRFGGALPFDIKYSVAEHSINLAEYVLAKYGDQELAALCLLHDASEAYLGDVVSPLKVYLSDYRLLECKISAIIYHKYNIDPRYGELVAYYDKCILVDEVIAMMPSRLCMFDDYEPLGITIQLGMNQSCIKEKFLILCRELNIQES